MIKEIEKRNKLPFPATEHLATCGFLLAVSGTKSRGCSRTCNKWQYAANQYLESQSLADKLHLKVTCVCLKCK